MLNLTQILYLFLLAVSRTLGGVVQDQSVIDILSNDVNEETLVIKKSIIPTTTPANPSSCSSDDVSENEVNSDEMKPCEVENKPENGTALILTPLIEVGRLEEAKNASKVNPELFLGFHSYSGFLTVDKRYNSNTFFWYFPQEQISDETPLILWLQGGPGGSSLVGLFEEIGPVETDSNYTLRNRNFTWLQNHSLVFFDNPVGSGYSFTDHEDGFATDLPTYTSHLYVALKQFLQLFPELKSAPLFLAGESYAGKYVPALAMEIHKFKDSPDGNINLKGLIMGNAYVGPEMLMHMELPYYYLGFLDKQQIQQMQPILDAYAENVAAGKSVEAKKKWQAFLSVVMTLTNRYNQFNFNSEDITIGEYVPFLKRSEIKRAIHVGDIHYDFLNVTVKNKLEPEFLSSTGNMMEQILEHYKILSYCGQFDLMVPCVSVMENHRRLLWKGKEDFINSTRYPYLFQDVVSGYCKSGGNLTEVIIRGAGHAAAAEKPELVRNLVTQWTHGLPFELENINDSDIDEIVTKAIAEDNSIRTNF